MYREHIILSTKVQPLFFSLCFLRINFWSRYFRVSEGLSSWRKLEEEGQNNELQPPMLKFLLGLQLIVIFFLLHYSFQSPFIPWQQLRQPLPDGRTKTLMPEEASLNPRSPCSFPGEVPALVCLGLEYHRGSLMDHLGAEHLSPCPCTL